ncbi:deoxyguanosinetriphosphate triphosphohydrolase [Candidatus Kinetoplastidibacterium crithidiae]|uniref:Deoxyguanosinetriphosphate triphosphohydrolase-like protein n=1 Tax=Candidatus Kinetoplastidibacterium crithidiae TCC036E TaxID=1208918 RepID=M1LV54_9PROT|nr:deoxyguanosinetriphosphate triphosphohydrolase [Candidatus Kinetoplastibacterium crithidii]AFZ82976.1 dGTPase [Candidatus Kinetoplastibacterium crithidii (ex Angomonas deanei ATCC 30255)]AGF47976.1 dGTPase [Candidatus Kinetoplastibacterium crithidii TCC036E]
MTSILMPYACKPEESKGRLYPENNQRSLNRNNFQRDRDRIIHSKAFRKLDSKTQVFINIDSSSCFRTRLTHSLEVSQIARTIARSMSLSEDLSEAIALAHDLGHAPFGHAGQEEINLSIKNLNMNIGAFEHNLQGLRIVDVLENRYINFNGLNLCFETREGILKHCSKQDAKKLGDIGARFIDGTNPSLEAQLVDYADEIAYNTHDIDDGLNYGLIELKDLKDLYIFGKCFYDIKHLHCEFDEKILILETIRSLINVLVTDLISNSTKIIKQINPKNVYDVRVKCNMIRFSEPIENYLNEIKSFLYLKLYRNDVVLDAAARGRHIIKTLFEIYMNDPRLLPKESLCRYSDHIHQQIVDYISSMTDRDAISCFKSFNR